MGMPQTAERWTAERVKALPADGNRYECVDGELLVTPAPRPRHQVALQALFLRLHPYLSERRLGDVLWSPADIEFDPDTLVQPDLFVLPPGESRRLVTWKDVSRLLLAVEVVSPSSARADRIVKRRRYQRAGVPEYWVVDLDARLIERWRPSDERPELLNDTLTWQPDPAHPALALDLNALFGDIRPPS
jgi:Uma2 family endonuclease